MVDNSLIIQLTEALKPDDFYTFVHNRIYKALLSLIEQGKQLDPVIVVEEMRKEGPADLGVVVNLLHGLPRISQLGDYAKLIKDNSTLRKLIRECNAIISEALVGERTATEMMEEAEARLYGIETGNPFSASVPVYVEANASVERALMLQNDPGTILGIPTGFADVDKKLRGSRPGQHIVLAGRPGSGKSALTFRILFNAAVHADEAVCLFSLEMSKEECADRIICSEANIDTTDFAEGNLRPDEWEKAKEVRERLKTAPFFIVDSPMITTRGIRMELRRLNTLLMKEGKRVAMFATDHLGLLRNDEVVRNRSREQEVSSFSRELKIIAREFDCTALSPTQMNRQVEGRQGHWPILSDLRDSGSIEADADVVAFIHREDMYEPDKSKHNNTAHFIIAKNRSGPTGFAKLQFTPRSTRFADLAYDFQTRQEPQFNEEKVIL